MAMSAEERGRLGAEKRWGVKDAPESEMSKWRITTVCYLNDRIYDPNAQPKDDNGDSKPLYLEYATEYPAWYMEPVNEAAKAVYERHPPKQFVDAINTLTQLPGQ